MSAPGATWQGEEMVSAYLRRRESMIPMLDVQEELIARLLQRHPRPIARFLDLGCGDGAMSQLVLSCRPEAEAVLVDFSEPMLEGAARRLGDGRWSAVRGDLSDPSWHAELARGSFGAVVSGLAIHHLPPAAKRALFAATFALLEPGGLFVNLDYVLVEGPLRGLFDERMVELAAEAEHARHGDRAAQDVRRALSEDGVGDEDLPDTAEEQVRWLAEAGFEQAEVHFKWAEAAVFGGCKPTGGNH